jgi:hypothetical protein
VGEEEEEGVAGEHPVAATRRSGAASAPSRPRSGRVMTRKYRGCIVVLSINKSVELNEEQKVLTSSFDQGFTVNTSKRVFKGIW